MRKRASSRPFATAPRAGVAVALAVVLVAAPASAQEGAFEERQRSALLEGSVAARTAGDHPRALALAQQAGALRMTPSLRQFIAEELLTLGRRGEALAAARTCLAEAEADVTARQREGVIADCRRLVASLEPPPAAGTPAPPPDVPPTVVAPVERARSAAPSVGQWVVGGAGVALLGGALVTFLMESSVRDEQRRYCAEDPATLVRACSDPRGVELGEERDTLRAVNYALFFGGLAAVGGAATWYLVDRLTGPSRGPTTWNLHVAPRADGASIAIGGAF